jgi:hypothetical protein
VRGRLPTTPAANFLFSLVLVVPGIVSILRSLRSL